MSIPKTPERSGQSQDGDPPVGTFEHADLMNRRRMENMTPDQRAELEHLVAAIGKRCAAQKQKNRTNGEFINQSAC